MACCIAATYCIPFLLPLNCDLKSELYIDLIMAIINLLHFYSQNMSGPVTPEDLAKNPSILLTNKFALGATTTGRLLSHLVES